MSASQLLQNLVRKYFSYLFDEYNFEIEKSEDHASFGGAFVRLKSEKCSVRVDWDGKWGEVILDLNPAKYSKGWKPKIYGFMTKDGKDPTLLDDIKDNWSREELWYDVMRMLNKKILTQSEKNKSGELRYVFPFMYHGDEKIEWQIKRLSRILKPYWPMLINYIDKNDPRTPNERNIDKPSQLLPDVDWSFLERNDRVGELIKKLSKEHISFKKDPNRGVNGITYSCCSTIMKNGDVIDCVCIVDKDEFESIWGNDYDGMSTINFSDINEIKHSPYQFSPLSGYDNVYTASETQENGYKFRVNMGRDDKKFPYKVSRLVDFIDIPPGYSMDDVTYVLAYYETKEEGPIDSTDYWKDGYLSNRKFHWCLV
ncbi:MAG: hypothetical protein PHG85_04240 [Candidatus Altiarchaeota archaeon]|nr:hypothetical protein [Candidatus Altiarchaeota archaeon]